MYVMAGLGTQGHVENGMERLTRTELPYPVKVSQRTIISRLVYQVGSVVPGRE